MTWSPSLLKKERGVRRMGAPHSSRRSEALPYVSLLTPPKGVRHMEVHLTPPEAVRNEVSCNTSLLQTQIGVSHLAAPDSSRGRSEK